MIQVSLPSSNAGANNAGNLCQALHVHGNAVRAASSVECQLPSSLTCIFSKAFIIILSSIQNKYVKKDREDFANFAKNFYP